MNELKRSELRKNTRLDHWDYSDDGYYFVTICVKDHREIFGKVENDEMVLNESGKIVKECWEDLPNHYSNCCLGEFIVMPNHIHGIVIIKNPVGTGFKPVPTNTKKYSLSEMIRGLKTFSSRRINILHPKLNFQWQRSFYDHIIRDEKFLENISDYIRYNAIKWELDRENPLNLKT